MIAVSSTAVGLTSLFEMGRGEHYSYQPHKFFELVVPLMGTSLIILWCYSFNIVKDVEQVRVLVTLIYSLVTKGFKQYI